VLQRFFSIIFLLAFVFTEVAMASLVWRPGEGWSNDDGGVSSQAANSRAQLEMARKMEAEKEWNKAKQSYDALVRRWPFSFHAGEAQFKTGWCSEKVGDFAVAFKAYQKCIEKYPASNFFEMALERQYNIANLFLAGEPQRIWKIPIMPSMEKTVEMYEQIIKNAPYGRYAAESQFKIGLGYEKQKKWSEAIRAYTMILDRYPGNDIVDDAQYQIGYAWYQAASVSDYDQGASQKAVDAFMEFITRFPNSEKIEQAKINIEQLKSRGTQGSFNIAKFYESQKQVEAAILYYNDVIQKDPASKQAEIARKKITELTPLKASGPPAPRNLAHLQKETMKDAQAAQTQAAAPTPAPLPQSGSADETGNTNSVQQPTAMDAVAPVAGLSGEKKSEQQATPAQPPTGRMPVKMQPKQPVASPAQPKQSEPDVDTNPNELIGPEMPKPNI